MPLKHHSGKVTEATNEENRVSEFLSKDDSQGDIQDVTANKNADGYEDMIVKCVAKFKTLKQCKNMHRMDDCVIQKRNEAMMIKKNTVIVNLEKYYQKNKSKFKMLQNRFKSP